MINHASTRGAASDQVQTQERMLSLLDLFEEDRPGWTFDEIHQKVGYTRSTLYRYLKSLTDAGLIASLPGTGYALGPRIIELDYQIRERDPLIRACRPMMQELIGRFPGVALLCRHYRDKVLCVHQETGTQAFQSNYERGRARPLLRGAASLAILANLQPHQVRRLHRDHAVEFAAAGLGTTLKEVAAGLKMHRRRGWVLTRGAVTPGVIGIAAPLFGNGKDVLGSLSLTASPSTLDGEKCEQAVEQVASYARIVSRLMS